MAVIKTKGTVFSMGLAGASAAIAQVISLDLPDVEVETFEADTLDNTNPGIPYKSTGRVEGGSIGGELFLDTTIHTALTGFLAAPPNPSDSPQGTASVTFGGGGSMSFYIAGISLGGTVGLKEGLKGKFTAKLDGAPVFA